MRGNIRKNKKLSWEEISILLKQVNWESVLQNRAFSNFGGFSTKEKGDQNIMRYSFRMQVSHPCKMNRIKTVLRKQGRTIR